MNTHDEHPVQPEQDPDTDRRYIVKDPDDWVTGKDPMTEAQAAYLKFLCMKTNEPLRKRRMTKAQASKRITRLEQLLGEADTGG